MFPEYVLPAGRRRQRLGSAGISHRDVAVRRHQDSGLGYKEGVVEAMSFTNVKTYSLPWPA
jgi:hypothetical protein